MNRLLLCIALLLLPGLTGGCMFFPRTYDGSESYYEAHPEQAVQPDYMHPQDQDGN